MVNKKENIQDNFYPQNDEGWWESVMADEIENPLPILPDAWDTTEQPQGRTLAGKDSPGTITHPAAISDEDLLEEVPTRNYSPRETKLKEASESDTPSQGLSKEYDQVDWEKACRLYEQDLAVLMQVIGYNRGGLLIGGNELQGFVPVSHLIDIPCADDDSEKWLLDYVDRSLFVKVIECDPARSRIVFSERAALSEPGSRIHLLNRLEPGDCVRGTITNITDFGVFVDLGGVEGLIHVSEISWGRVHHPGDLLQLDQRVDVYVIQVDRERARVALSMKRLHPNPWATASERYFPGLITDAVVTSVVPFGAFARLEEGLDGLIHISEICPDKGETKRMHLQEGQQVTVRILHVDCERQRLGLSLQLNDI